jgi:hypothetical protein
VGQCNNDWGHMGFSGSAESSERIGAYTGLAAAWRCEEWNGDERGASEHDVVLDDVGCIGSRSQETVPYVAGCDLLRLLDDRS